MHMAESDALRSELADVAASLRAYLEQQAGSGATGIPRGRGPTRASATSTSNPTPNPTPNPNPNPHPNPSPSPSPSPTPTPSPSPTPTPTPNPNRTPSPTATSHATSTPRSADPLVRLPELAREIASCTLCRLSESRTKTVFARGNPASAICFIGEAPGAEEDAQGLPFVGRAGQLLDKMIGAMGLSPEKDAYIVNIIRCRPPDNRRPEPDEIAACLPYLHEQLELVKPKVIVALGNTSVGALLGTKVGISKLRGQWKLYRGTTLVMPTYHPSYLLRPSAQQAEAKKQAWEDLQAVLTELKLPIPAPKKRAVPRSGEESS